MKPNKLIWVFVVTVIATTLALAAAGHFLNKQVKSLVFGLADKLSLQLGQKVTIDKVVTRWQWFNLNIDIKDLVIYEKESNIPLCMVSDIVSSIAPIDSLLSMDIKFKHLLLRSPRVMLQWNGTSIPHIAGLEGEQINEAVDPTKFLQILSMQQRITIVDGDFHIQGLEGTDLPLMNVNIEVKRKEQLSYNIFVRGSIAAATPAEFNLAVHYTGSLENLDKYMLEFEVKTSNIQMENLLNLLPSLRQNYIQGTFADLDIKGAIQNNELRYLHNDFNIENIAFGGHTSLVKGGGHIEWQPTDEWLKIKLNDLHISNKSIYSEDIIIDSIFGAIKPTFKDNELTIATEDLRLITNNIEFMPQAEVHIVDEQLQSLILQSKITNAHVNAVKVLLPDQFLSTALYNWLHQALVNGYVSETNINYQNGNLMWKTDFRDVELVYANNWPSIRGLDASLILEHNKLFILAERADILGNKFNMIKADFVNKGDKTYGFLEINGNVDTTLESGLNFLLSSPLKSGIGAKIAALDPKGNMHLDLKLNIDLTTDELEVETSGKLLVEQASIQIPETQVKLQAITGPIIFGNKDVHSDKLLLELFNNPAVAKIAMHGDAGKQMRVSLSAPIKLSDMQAALPNLNLKHITGATNFTAQLDIPWDEESRAKTLNLSSDLQGVGLDYPSPLNKQAKAKLPLTVKYIMRQNGKNTVHLKLSNALAANLSLDQGQLAGAHLAFGTDKIPNPGQNNFLISGKLAEFDLDTWQNWLEANPGTAALPLETDLYFDNLRFRGENYKNIAVKYQATSNTVTLNSPLVTGTVQMSKDEVKYIIKLQKLDLGDVKVGENKIIKTLHEKNKAKTLPLIDFHCEQLLYKQQSFRKVNLQLLPRTYGYEITELSIASEILILQAQGQWQMEGKEFTQLSGNAYTKDLGKVLRDWKYGSSVAKGNGEVNFSLQWEGDPTAVDYVKLDGGAHIDIKDGVITSIKPGLGRIIGLLSLDSIQRRLQLDFSDIVSKGFVFDRLETDIELKPGSLSAEKVLINSPSARIEISGKSNLNTHELDLVMFVTPKLGVGIPVAAAVAVANPAVGAVLWAFDLASGSKISELTMYKYRVTGTWEAPQMNPLSDKLK